MDKFLIAAVFYQVLYFLVPEEWREWVTMGNYGVIPLYLASLCITENRLRREAPIMKLPGRNNQESIRARMLHYDWMCVWLVLVGDDYQYYRKVAAAISNLDLGDVPLYAIVHKKETYKAVKDYFRSEIYLDMKKLIKLKNENYKKEVKTPKGTRKKKKVKDSDVKLLVSRCLGRSS